MKLKLGLKGLRFVTMEEIQDKLKEALDTVTIGSVVISQREYFEGDKKGTKRFMGPSL